MKILVNNSAMMSDVKEPRFYRHLIKPKMHAAENMQDIEALCSPALAGQGISILKVRI